MSDFLSTLSSLQEQMRANFSRSDVLRPLAWLAGILVIALIGLANAKADSWLLLLIAIFLSAAILIYGFTFLYCLFKDRDALRSESYSLQKLAITHGLYGDSGTGLIDATASKADDAKMITSSNVATAREEE